MRVESSRFGVVDVKDEHVINMTKGLYGFGEIHKFVIVEHRESGPFKWFQSVDCPDLAFVIVDPANFFPGYEVQLSPEDRKDLELEEDRKPVIYVTVVIPSDLRQMTANMLGPIIINPDTMLAKQVVLMDDRYNARQSLLQNAN